MLQEIVENAIVMLHGVDSEFVSRRRAKRLNTNRINTVQPVQKFKPDSSGIKRAMTVLGGEGTKAPSSPCDVGTETMIPPLEEGKRARAAWVGGGELMSPHGAEYRIRRRSGKQDLEKNTVKSVCYVM
jgi:hypothetical protein